MGQGQDKIAQSLLDLQPTAIVELFLLYFNTVDKENSFIAFHGGSLFSESLTWQGIKYIPLPVETEGFEVNANGQMARPKIRISNKDYFVTDLLLNNNDLQFAKIIRKRTFVKYLDNDNFDGGNPWGQADASAEISNDTFVISQKTAENKVFVEFELTSPLDLDNFDINNRLILSRYCSWYYRGNGCNYQGPPVETEDGRKLNLNNNAVNGWYKTVAPWETGQQFQSGDAVYIENKKIIVFDPNDSVKKDFAKIWYVCQSGHTSSLDRRPDANETIWLRDGCNKKLDGCKKRFQKTSKGVFNTEDFSVTNSYIDFSHKAGVYAYNNIAPQASVTKSAHISPKYRASNIKDLQTGFGSGYSWAAPTDSNPWIQLTWDTAKTIDRIDLYDLPGTTNNFNNAYITFYNGESLVKSGILENIPTDGSRITSGFDNISVTSIRVSGSGCVANDRIGLGEISVFEPTGLKLTCSDFNSNKVHQSNFWQLSSWIQFPSGLSKFNRYNAVLHNISTNCRYSGINVFVKENDLILNFATVLVSGETPEYIVQNRQLAITWSDADKLKPLHIVCSGGKTEGLEPETFNEGFIRLSGDGQNFAEFNLRTKDISQNISGEFFLFKNDSYQNGITNLKFGINDWQFSNSVSTPEPSSSSVTANLETTSNIKFGATAIWTGRKWFNARNEFFNRRDEQSLLTNALEIGLTPRKYSELPNSYKSGLYAWWDMNLSNSAPYIVESSNIPSKTLELKGNYVSSIDKSETVNYLKSSTNPKSSSEFLPFGGFPGTDRYGR